MFLEELLPRVFKEIVSRECTQDIDIFIHNIVVKKTDLNFSEFVVAASHEGMNNYGIMALAVHADADKFTYEERRNNKIIPAQEALFAQEDSSCCKILLPIIPVKMTESWMLADKQLFKDEINTKLSDQDLGLTRQPEVMANPKDVIKEAIRIATENLPKRRTKVSIEDLYSSIGSQISIKKLETLSSFLKFEDEIRNTLQLLHYLP